MYVFCWHVYLYVYTHIYITLARARTRAHTHAHTHARTHTHAHTHLHTHTHAHTHTHTHTHTHIHTHTHTHSHTPHTHYGPKFNSLSLNFPRRPSLPFDFEAPLAPPPQAGACTPSGTTSIGRHRDLGSPPCRTPRVGKSWGSRGLFGRARSSVRPANTPPPPSSLPQFPAHTP